jgi:hypothetical protein
MVIYVNKNARDNHFDVDFYDWFKEFFDDDFNEWKRELISSMQELKKDFKEMILTLREDFEEVFTSRFDPWEGAHDH